MPPYRPPPVAVVPVAPPPSVAMRFCMFMQVWWTVLFAGCVFAMQCIVEPKQGWSFPPKLDFSGEQAKRVMSTHWFWVCWIPLVLGVVWLRNSFKKHNIGRVEQGMMLWWLTNACFFHVHCDILSGYYQVMPGLTEHYTEIGPAHAKPRWANGRVHLDATYVLEGLVEVPLAVIMLFLYTRRHPGRHIVEIFAVAVQFAGTIIYYLPRFFKGEKASSWLCWFDWAFGAVWIIFPLCVLYRHFSTATRAAGADKKS